MKQAFFTGKKEEIVCSGCKEKIRSKSQYFRLKKNNEPVCPTCASLIGDYALVEKA
jgi:formylmethanofuran dehydrogenase subunit E